MSSTSRCVRCRRRGRVFTHKEKRLCIGCINMIKEGIVTVRDVP